MTPRLRLTNCLIRARIGVQDPTQESRGLDIENLF